MPVESSPSASPRLTLHTQPVAPKTSSMPPELRSNTQEQQQNRRMFDKLAWLIHSCSSQPYQKNETTGEYVMPDEKIKKHLAHETGELKQQSALINLLLHLDKTAGNPESAEEELYVGSYKVIWPSIKQLNDSYLGPNQTDDFIDELHKAIREILGQDKAQLLRITFKSGIFVVDLSQIRATLNGGTQNHIKERMVEILQIAKDILLTNIVKRRKTLEEKLSSNDPEKIYQNISHLDELSEQLISRKRGIDIAFGFEKLNDRSPDGAFTAIHQAERAANLAAIDSKNNGTSNGNNGEGKEQVKARQYSHIDLLTNFFVALDKVEKEVIHRGKLKSGWERFFMVTTEENTDLRAKAHSIRMQKNMIEIYRRIDKYRLSAEYRNMSKKKQEDFENKLEVFGEYYQRINVVDVLKDTTEAHHQEYILRIQQITGLIKEAENALNADTPNPLHQRELLSRVSGELEVSLKDRGTGVIRTTRSTIKALMSGENAILAETDNIGFGIRNQRDYENSVYEIIRLFKMTQKEWKKIRGTKIQMKAYLREKIESLKKDQRFNEILSSIGDAGTSYLRTKEEHLSKVFGGLPVINADGGDETAIVYTEAVGCTIPENPIAIEKKLLEVSRTHRVRIAAVTGDLRFAPIDDPDNVTDESRQQILRYIRGKHWTEDAQGYIKALNEKGLLTVEVRDSSLL